jgi:hypothetical protein
VTSGPDVEQLYETIAAGFRGQPGVTEGTGFGSSPGLRVSGKIFMMLVKGQLVLKLPKQRVDELVASGAGFPFDSGRGRPMKEWVSIPAERGTGWESLAREAMLFVSSGASGRRG